MNIVILRIGKAYNAHYFTWLLIFFHWGSCDGIYSTYFSADDKWEKKENTLSFQENLRRNKHKEPVSPSFPFQFHIDFYGVSQVTNGLRTWFNI